ncbi:chromate efflux transporter [Erythrobacter sp. sf7]|uniref:Chromate efflux transporter n=1 Tax=Erythrobacter fulvus TaxID=2987523 RepID=A0ABT5JQ09_9SPHN|nr:chromate efflux transporter [Erythrobacter fulvus]MDC8754764.1 chromate efflux transporter [Erythrobacter fulvus]
MPLSIPFPVLLRAFARIGLLSFGGPAGQIALMHRELVEEREWIGEEDFLHALNFCHLLPGPEAQQLATWIGWRLHGWRGGLAAGLLFVIPGAIIILSLSTLYAMAADLAWVEAVFLGIKAAVLAIVVQALVRIAGRALDTVLKRLLALAAFAGLFLFDLPFPLIVLGAGLIGIGVSALRPEWLALKSSGVSGALPARPWRSTILSVLLWGAVWAAPMVLIAVTLGQDHVLWEIGTFFSQLAIVTFGGAYAVLAYMAQEAVQDFGWLRPGEMADGLGLAETTPGPLILVTQFVGYLAAFRAPEPFSPLVAGLLGAALTTWVTFTPCFLWIFAFAPWIDRLGQTTRLKGGLAAVTAAVVGVIANLTAWFALHVLFEVVGERRFGLLRVYWPDPASLDWRAGALALVACLLAFCAKWSVLRILAACGAGGLMLGLTI